MIPDRARIRGESFGKVMISFGGGAFSLKVDPGGNRYDTGTITVTQNSQTVTGSGTLFNGNVAAGDFITVGNNFLEISDVKSDTELELKYAYRGRTLAGQTYIARTMYSGIELSNLIIVDSSLAGLDLTGTRHCSFNNVGAYFNSPNFCVTDSGDSAMNNTMIGHSASDGIVLDNCFDFLVNTANVYNNANNGIVLKGISNGIIFDHCTSSINGNHGFQIEDTADVVSFTDCIAKQNAGKGMNSESGTGSLIVNSCHINDNGADGIDFDGSLNSVNGCICRNNGGNGIQAGTDGIMLGNQCSGNGSNAINLTGDTDCTVLGNRCVDNSGTGIFVNDDDNIMIGNRCSGNNIGIDIDTGTNNIVVANHLEDNTSSNFTNNGSSTNITQNET